MITTITAKTPPTTADGIAASNADNLPKNPKITNQIPAATNTLRLATSVIETIPALVEYPVIGVLPRKDEIKQLRPSPITPRFHCLLVISSFVTALMANHVPVVSVVKTIKIIINVMIADKLKLIP